MARLKPYNYARLIVQGLGFVPGLFGMALVYISIGVLVSHKASENFFYAMLFAVTFSGIGVTLMFLSYKWIRKFSIVTIKCISLIVAFWFFDWFSDSIETYIEKIPKTPNIPNIPLAGHVELLVLASISLALLLYFICRDMLIILTRANEDQQNT